MNSAMTNQIAKCDYGCVRVVVALRNHRGLWFPKTSGQQEEIV
jgi:hypothetical protein